MNTLLAPHVGAGRTIRVTRRTPCEPTLRGYLLAMSDSLALMHVFHDFQPDGYVIIRTSDVEAVRCGPYEQWWDHVLEREGACSGLRLPFRPDLTDMRSAIENVSAEYEQLIVKCEDEDEDIQDFHIGALMWSNENEIVMRHYDGLGYWKAVPAEIDIEDVSQVQFDTPYINCFSKYTREGEPPDMPDDER